MRRTSFANMKCSVARTLEVVGEWWTMLIVREAFRGVTRFDDFQANLGIARNVLSERLRSLVEHGIMERRLYRQSPPRYEYRLTEKGMDLYPTLLSLLKWGDRWAADEAGPPLVLTHLSCGARVHGVLTCEHCGEPLHARDVRATPGPGAAPAVDAR